jgi:peptidoglycan/LPS O-acetylase OafA/YrhL
MPAVVLALALIQLGGPSLGEKISGVSDITYASYLTHFPLQLALAPVMVFWGVALTSWIYFLIYMLSVIAVSISTYRYFEIPSQNFLRRPFLINLN